VTDAELTPKFSIGFLDPRQPQPIEEEADCKGKQGDLQCEEAVVDLDLLGEEIGANGGLVLVAELPVDVPARASRGTRITPPNEGMTDKVDQRDKAKLTGSSATSCRPCQEARA
jgi:hypothetical protein